jgi:hypothetical protein
MIEGNAKDLGDWLGVGERRVRQLQQAEVFCRLPSGMYDIRACVQATLRHYAEAAAGRKAPPAEAPDFEGGPSALEGGPSALPGRRPWCLT